MMIRSVEATYRIEVLQVIFEDTNELVIKVGYPVGQEHDIDIDIEWVDGEAPEWAADFTPEELLEMAEEHNELE